jgi:hypothetical protein
MNKYEWERFEPMAFVMFMAGALAGGFRGTDAAAQAEEGIKIVAKRFPVREEPAGDE